MRAINAAQATYAEQHRGEGYAPTLKRLGPAPGANLIDGVLASGEKSSYTFTLFLRMDEQGRVAGYQLVARPKKYGRNGTLSFLATETGEFHVTAEDRTPTLQDPKLE